MKEIVIDFIPPLEENTNESAFIVKAKPYIIKTLTVLNSALTFRELEREISKLLIKGSIIKNVDQVLNTDIYVSEGELLSNAFQYPICGDGTKSFYKSFPIMNRFYYLQDRMHFSVQVLYENYIVIKINQFDIMYIQNNNSLYVELNDQFYRKGIFLPYQKELYESSPNNFPFQKYYQLTHNNKIITNLHSPVKEILKNHANIGCIPIL